MQDFKGEQLDPWEERVNSAWKNEGRLVHIFRMIPTYSHNEKGREKRHSAKREGGKGKRGGGEWRVNKKVCQKRKGDKQYEKSPGASSLPGRRH